ncbi:MAG: HisA/HisF-related TIM barrel protein [Candidatus Tyrphobacter sp.]
MIVIPAIDLAGGVCVRMEAGDMSTATVYDRDPVARAQRFVDAGAQRLHVVDLDGAFGSGENARALERICAAAPVPVQTGGGIRTLETARARLETGASEVILGTVLVEEERAARNIIGSLGARVIAAIDARGSEIATHGWTERTPVDRDALVRRVTQWGVTRVIFTEIRHDGMGLGYDLAALRAVAGAAPVTVTASGGARTLEDLRALRAAEIPAVDSCIVGSALYKGTIELRDAIEAVA